MKKIYLVPILCSLLMFAGCASERSNVRSIEPGEPKQHEKTVSVESTPFAISVDPKDGEDKVIEIMPEVRRTVPEDNNGDLSLHDFDFYYDLMNTGIPADADYPALLYAEGDWRYDFIIRKENADGFYYEEIGYSELLIDYDKETVQIILHPRLANDGFEAWLLSDEEIGYEPFDGGFDENDVLKLIGNNCVLTPTHYYRSGGKEYFIGDLWMSEQDSALFMMTRD
ncbi:MAG: hypothetical protein K6A70_00370 [Erysipelotrichaceae bacterium]|nr:hypothetical protein [Erysipelotrichaceae bacterium]